MYLKTWNSTTNIVLVSAHTRAVAHVFTFITWARVRMHKSGRNSCSDKIWKILRTKFLTPHLQDLVLGQVAVGSLSWREKICSKNICKSQNACKFFLSQLRLCRGVIYQSFVTAKVFKSPTLILINLKLVGPTKVFDRIQPFLLWYFVTKIVLTYCSSDQENLQNFTIEQWNVRSIFGNRMLF